MRYEDIRVHTSFFKFFYGIITFQLSEVNLFKISIT